MMYSCCHRFKRVTLQITTQNPELVVKEFIHHSKHGISVVESEAIGVICRWFRGEDK